MLRVREEVTRKAYKMNINIGNHGVMGFFFHYINTVAFYTCYFQLAKMKAEFYKECSEDSNTLIGEQIEPQKL